MIARATFLLLCFAFNHAKVWRLDCNQIRQFVDGHNTRRLLVAKGQVPEQPAASKMALMVWDEELASKAAKWAAQNKFQHNPNRNIASKKYRSGENLFIFSTTAKNYKFQLDVALESWFKEHKDYTYRPISRTDFAGRTGPVVGHYTQMIWSSSVYVGCAVSEFREGKWNNFLVVCNYGPAGNVIKQKPYPSGEGVNTLVCEAAGKCSQPYGSKCPATRIQNRNKI